MARTMARLAAPLQDRGGELARPTRITGELQAMLETPRTPDGPWREK